MFVINLAMYLGEVRNMEAKVGKPRELTDAEAEAFIRYLSRQEKKRREKIELMSKYDLNRLIEEYVKKHGWMRR